MWTIRYYKRLFIMRATWNWTTTIVLVTTWRHFLAFFNMYVPEVPVWIYLSCGLIFISGVGNYLVSLKLDENHGLLIVDIMGRILFFSLFTYYYFTGEAHPVFVLIGIIDMALAALAFEFLLRYKNNKIVTS
jgi:hypothetical protein